ncbi:squalene--hopene cyclase [Pelagibius sp. CAU 1746]|uniref:squalene--hopene cyclase n=1 Tax=Pelagibius sp. CAU 1746 TaxID=3140370 RepID=UPI00325B3A6A
MTSSTVARDPNAPAARPCTPCQPAPLPDLDAVDALVGEMRAALQAEQRPDGHWLFELEADATIPAEYIFLQHFLGQVDTPKFRELEPKLAKHLRAIQGAHGGWPLFHDGDLDISASVKAYFALKLAGDDPEAPHMLRARTAILAVGGAAQSNVFTRIALALFGQVPWRAVPEMPVEIMLLPRWFPFHLSKVSYWSRTVIAPLLIVMDKKPEAANPRGVDIRELFVEAPEHAHYQMNATGSPLGAIFAGIDRVLRLSDPLRPRAKRQKAIHAAMEFVKERLNGEDGLGGIFPAMANAAMAFHALGYDWNDRDYSLTREAIDRLLFHRRDGSVTCQPCLSPIWDTCLAAHAMLEAGEPGGSDTFTRAFDWLLEREITEVRGDWAWRRAEAPVGGWPFQYNNAHYPDVDDTAVVVMAMDRAGSEASKGAMERAAKWVIAMQSKNGGWGAFDADNAFEYLNHIPFADHGALLDPPTVDVSARCLSMLAQLGYGRDNTVVRRGLDYVRREQEEDGSWYGRWGVNYVYGTWSVLCALNACGEDMQAPYVRKAVNWLKDRQQPDGGWGEDCATYWLERRDEAKASTASQTAWALLGLMAAGEVESDAVKRGVAYLQGLPREGARWAEDYWTGNGFPRVFYLKYHGYSAYFPLWALARYRNLMRSNERRVSHGM